MTNLPQSRVWQATVSKDYRLTLPAAVAAAYAPGFETVVVAAPGGDGAGADHWRLYAPAAWDAVLPAFAASPKGDALRCVSSSIALPVTKTRRLTLGVAVRGLGLVLCPPAPFAAVLVALPGFCEVWPRSNWSHELERAMHLPAALAGLNFD
jgi:hypothetical protein